MFEHLWSGEQEREATTDLVPVPVTLRKYLVGRQMKRLKRHLLIKPNVLYEGIRGELCACGLAGHVTLKMV